MIHIYEETEIRERKEELRKFNEFVKLWEENFGNHLEILLMIAKEKNIKLEEIKKQLRKTFDDILDDYHEVEKYHKL